jgi:hypothetical protein
LRDVFREFRRRFPTTRAKEKEFARRVSGNDAKNGTVDDAKT